LNPKRPIKWHNSCIETKKGGHFLGVVLVVSVTEGVENKREEPLKEKEETEIHTTTSQYQRKRGT